MARAVCAPGSDGIYGVFVLHLLSFLADSRRNSLLPARFQELLGGDDVFRGRLRFRLRDGDVFSSAEPLVHPSWDVAWRTCWRAVYGADQFHREMRTCAWRGVSFAARGRCDGGAV